MKFETIQLTSMLYAIPYTDKPMVYSLIVKSVNKKFYLGNNTYTLEVLFPNGETRYLKIYDGYVNDPQGDDISKPFINNFLVNPEWRLDSSKVEDYTKYLIFDNHNELIDEYIKQIQGKIDYDRETIHNLSNEITRNKQIIDYVKHQKYEE